MNRELLDRKIEEYCEQNHISGVIRVTVRDRIQYEKSNLNNQYWNKPD